MSQDAVANPSPSKGQAGVDPHSIPLEKIDVSDGELFETDTHWGYFERLRKEDPVHALVGATGVTEKERRAALEECLEVFQGLWGEREGR